jgi:hypothetical protein
MRLREHWRLPSRPVGPPPRSGFVQRRPKAEYHIGAPSRAAARGAPTPLAFGARKTVGLSGLGRLAAG